MASWVNVDGVRVCEVDYLARLGKKRQAIIEHALGGTTIGDLMERFAGKTTRRRDFLKRTLGPLSGLDGGPTILVISGDAVRLVDGWREALENARQAGQEQEATERQLVNYELQRAAFRTRDKVRVDRHPANVGADGYVEDLEHFEEIEDFSDCELKPVSPAPSSPFPPLYALIDKRVRTTRGYGKLWQVFSDRIGVVLESEPDQVTFLAPGEVEPVLKAVA